MKYHLGTVGFGYKDWDGAFYPSKTPSKEYLEHYSKIFNSVEIDTSFYGCPSIKQVEKWCSKVPKDFKFCYKTPRQITHDSHLFAVDREIEEFLENISHASERLGPVLIQLPPDFSTEGRENLVKFTEKINKIRETKDPKLKFAYEFRHKTWYTDWTKNFLTINNIGWVSLDYLKYPKEINQTSDFLYFRFIGQHGRYEVKTHVRDDRTKELGFWKEEIEKTKSTEIYGYFNNDYSGHSPATCNRFKEILGLQIEEPSITEQITLF